MIVALLLLWLFQDSILASLTNQATIIPYSQFKQKLAAGEIVDATIGDSTITGDMQNRQSNSTVQPNTNAQTVPFITVFAPDEDPTLVADLQKAGIPFSFQHSPSPLGSILLSWVLPIAALAGLWFFSYRSMGAGGAGGIFGVGRSKATVVQPETVGITFKDVGGADEPIAELREIIEFLRTPEQFARLGGHVPQRGAAGWPARHRQDPARQGECRRGWRAVLRDQRRRVRRDVRRRGRRAGA